MVNLTDVIIIAIALAAAFGAFMLFLSVMQPMSGQKDTQEIRKIRLKAEATQARIAEILNTVQHGAHDAEALGRQLKDCCGEADKAVEATRSRSEDVEQTIVRVKSAEQELRTISGQLGERIQYVQTYWDEQLNDTVDTVRKVHQKLATGLEQVDGGLLRLREQEKMAQGFTQKLVEHQREQFTAQQENARLATEVNAQLQGLLQESTRSVQNMQQQQARSDELFQHFSTEIQEMERQAHEYFTGVFQVTDAARQELSAGLEENRNQLEQLRQQGEQGNAMSGRIREQFEQVGHLPVESLTKVVGITDEMCADLQRGLENARNLLKTLEEKTTQVIDESEASQQKALQVVSTTDKGKGHNLFSMRAYR